MSLEASLAAFFQRVADAFLRGDHTWLAGVYAYPLAVFIEGEIAIEQTPLDTLNALWRRREHAISQGTTDIRSELVEIGDVRGGRIPARVDWYFLNAEGAVIAVNEMRYFCRMQDNGTPIIEILEFVRRGLREERFSVH